MHKHREDIFNFSLLKAGYMGTVLVMSEASYLDSADEASSAKKTTQHMLLIYTSPHVETRSN